MLQTIRSNLQGTIAKVIIALMVIPFAVFGIDSFFGASNNPVVATVNGEEIKEAELQRAVALQKRRLIAMMGEQVPPSMLDDSVLRQPALESLIEQQVMLQAAENIGLDASTSLLNRTIVQMEQFQEDGRFSQQRYEQLLRSQGFSPAFFKELLASDLLLQQLRSGVAQTAFVAEPQLELAAKLAKEKRNFNYVVVDPSAFSDSFTISEEDILAHYEANPDAFTSAPAVQFNYIELREADFYTEVDPAKVRADYDREVELLQQQAQRRVAHILLETGDRKVAEAIAKAAELRSELGAGASFEELAKQHSEDAGSADSGGDLGINPPGTFPPEFEQAAASLGEGEISDPVVTEAGVHLIKVAEVLRPNIPAFEQRRPVIEQQLQAAAARPALVARVDELRDLVFNAENLQAPAQALTFEVKTSDLLSQDADAGLFAFPAVKEAAFSEEVLEQRLNSDVLELAPDHYLVLHVARHEPSAVLPLESVRDEIVATLRDERAREKAQEVAAVIAGRLREGEDAKALAEEFGVSWQAGIRVGRDSTDIASDIRRAAFSISKTEQGGVKTINRPSAGDQVVMKLLDVFPGDLNAMPPREREAFVASLARNEGARGFNTLYQQLRAQADISVK